MKLLCKLFGHSWRVRVKWVPSFSARIVEEVWDIKTCKRCGFRTKVKWFDWKQFKKEHNFSPIVKTVKNKSPEKKAQTVTEWMKKRGDL